MTVDAHLHFWKLSRGDYSFPLPNDELLYRDFLPSDLAIQLVDAKVDATIAVQATETRAETEFLLALAERTESLSGVVGWCDLSMGNDVRKHLAELSSQGPLVAIRPMLQKSDSADWLLEHHARTALKWMADNNLAFDALVDVRHIATLAELGRLHPELHIIINHFGKPWNHPELLLQWQSHMQSIASLPNIWVKVSGFPAGNDVHPKTQPLPELLRFLTSEFGPDKLIWGSDWPVSKRHWSYQDALQTMQRLFSIEDRSKVFHANALQAYRIELSTACQGTGNRPL